MLRDIIKTSAYFNAYIENEDKRIAKFSEKLSTLVDENKKSQCEGYIASFIKNKMSAQYSRGDSREEVRKTFDAYLEHIGKSKISSYADYVDMLSLLVIFNVDTSKLRGLKSEGVKNDALMQSLLSHIVKKASDKKISVLAYPDTYSSFYDFLEEKISEKELLDFVSTKWYASCKDVYWYDSHKSKENTYAGYWCWLAAAVLKIKNGHFSTEISCKYFPSDLGSVSITGS